MKTKFSTQASTSKIYLPGPYRKEKRNSYSRDLFEEQSALKIYLLLVMCSVLVGNKVTDLIFLNKLTNQTESQMKKNYFAIYLFAFILFLISFCSFRQNKSRKIYIIRLITNIFACLLLIVYFAIDSIDSLENALRQKTDEGWSVALENLSSLIYMTLLASILMPQWYLRILMPSCYYLSMIWVYWRNNHPMKYWMLLKGIFNLVLVGVLTLIQSKVRWRLFSKSFEAEKLKEIYKHITDKLPSAVAILDLKQNVLYSNHEFGVLLEKGYQSKEKLFASFEQLKKRTSFFHSPSRNMVEFNFKTFDQQEITSSLQDGQKEEFDFSKSKKESPRVSVLRKSVLLKSLQVPKTPENMSSSIDTLQRPKNLKELFEKLQTIMDKDRESVSNEENDYIYDSKLTIFDPETQQKNGNLSYEVRLVPMYEFQKFVLILNETTQRDSLASQENNSQYRDRLLSSVSHQIRTPLNGNLACLQAALSDSRVPKIIKECLIDPALKSSKLLLHVVNDILDFSQIQLGEFQLSLECKNLRDTFTSSYKLLEKAIKLKNLEYIFDFDLNCPEKFTTDHERLTQIILNILSNALKFTFSGKIILKMSCIDKNCIEISVEDTGVGMSETEMLILLSEFDNPSIIADSEKKSKGIGFGLKISNYLVRQLEPKSCLYKGIKAESTEGKGSIFSFRIENRASDIESYSDVDELRLDIIPVQNNFDEFEEDSDFGSDISLNEFDKKYNKFSESYNSVKKIESPFLSHKNSVSSNKSILGQESKKASNKDVLVVDDDPINILGLRLLLNKLSLSIDTAYNGKQAIDKVQEKFRTATTTATSKYKLIIMDCQMPVMDGYEATKELVKLMKDAQIPETPIIGCTAFTAKNKFEECLLCGMDSVVAKPVSFETLKKTIRKYIK